MLSQTDDTTPQIATIRIRPFGVSLPVRAGTADAQDVMDSLVGRYHLPPSALEPNSIVDAGLCTGLTLIDLALRYPAARVIGIEPQPYYANLSRSLARRLQDRVEVVEAALWPEDDANVALHVTPGWEFGASLVTPANPVDEVISTTTVSLNAIVARIGTIDYLKLDIEGAEREVLSRNTQWASRTRCVNVELHHGYTINECIRDLSRLGFRCAPHERHWASVVGLRAA